MTGLSGSGKSSLAFDTIYAEGQRRYVESLSAYARQFLQMMEKPDVDSIDGLSPAISIDQKTTSRNPRSTVGTVTEIYDYLRLLYARVGRPHCPVCGRPIAGQSLDQIVEQVLALPEGTRFTVNAPIVRDRKGEFRDVLEELRRDGFTRVKVDGEQRLLEEEIVLDKKFKHTIEVVVDRLVMKPDLRLRLTQTSRRRPRSPRVSSGSTSSTATTTSSARTSRAPSTASRCPSSSRGSSPSTRRTAPARAARARLAARDRPRPARARPEPLDRGGRARPVVARRPGVLRVGDQGDRRPLRDRPPHALARPRPARSRTASSSGRAATGSSSPTRTGWAASASTRWRSRGSCRTSSAATARPTRASQRERIEEYMSMRPCPVCHGARLKPEVLAVTVGGKSIHAFAQQSVTAALRFVDELELTPTEDADRPADPEGDPRAADVPRRRRRRLPQPRPRGADALRRRGAAAAARDADRLAARRRPLHPRRAVDRAAPARQRPADRRRSSGSATSATPCSSSSTTSR